MKLNVDIAFKRRILNWLIDTAVFLICGLPIVYAFEHIVDAKTLHHALEFQKGLYESVKNLDPGSLFSYLVNIHDLLFSHVGNLYNFLLSNSHEVFQRLGIHPAIAIVVELLFRLFLSAFALVAFFLLWVVIIIMLPIVLPLAALMQGNYRPTHK